MDIHTHPRRAGNDEHILWGETMNIWTNDRRDRNSAASLAALNAKIACYIHADGIEELYSHMLERMERLCGRAITSEILRYLWASRSGLTLAELAGLCNRRARIVEDA